VEFVAGPPERSGRWNVNFCSAYFAYIANFCRLQVIGARLPYLQDERNAFSHYSLA